MLCAGILRLGAQKQDCDEAPPASAATARSRK